ncbi:RagB/SusD family nutrient uptake outer membrane protein [Cellulophaga baltica]|uniref:RagB/SusD family nutrient uptake outer membrane protein n=1 Tax=Cellulophaga TaxID=104264 RepID=UPI001C066979|nr:MULTISPECIES: RagB/SusD family nutrient uptake outer membrane protein [Cellulophaga]MBU2995224.1 RagB/SusD family nutrient uptake outer membrane protein [Cellulophaga baltica]MDO6766619.1 RagB/SusD family nutrient uptake outer membrane protein [Cellulophaga sp. 1_MG-2023]
MKNIRFIYKLILGISLGFSAIGCSDLEEEPIALLSPEGYFEDTSDIQSAVDGALTHAINEEVWGRKLSVALMLRSDMVDLQSTETRRVEMNTHTISGDNEMVYDPWTRMYLGISAANTAIAGAEDVDAEDSVKNPVTAQAYFARAFYYFHLVRLFGEIPYFDSPVTDTDAGANVSGTSEEEVYANIISDLEFAKTWLPETVTSRAIPSKGAASSYLALVYLTMAGNDSGSEYWQMAYDEAKEVIDNAGTYNYALDSDFQSLFNAEKIDASLEPIFALDYNNVEADDNAYDQTCPMTGVRGDDDDEGWSIAVPSLDVYQSFDEDDYRRRVSFQTEATIGGVTVDYTNFTESGHAFAANRPYIAKYTRYPGPYARSNKRATSHNYSMIRYAEVLLIAAEAAVEIGNNAAALTYVNLVRERARLGGSSTNGGYVEETIAASTVPADLTGTVTVDDVLEERRLELAFEGIRWYDIKRRELGDEVFSASGYEGAKSDWSSAVDYDTPIPDEELNRMPNISN